MKDRLDSDVVGIQEIETLRNTFDKQLIRQQKMANDSSERVS
jgi:hypothetical protein